MKIHAFRLKPGDDLRLSIEEFVSKNRIKAGIMLACVGSLTRVALRFANEKSAAMLEGPFEIVSMEATLSMNGCHLHISVADGQGLMKGGHLMAGSLVFTTAEVVVGEIQTLDFNRKVDEATGFRELFISQH